jgi:hypothetical protein
MWTAAALRNIKDIVCPFPRIPGAKAQFPAGVT